MLYFVSLLFFLVRLLSAYAYTSPVLLWGANSVSKPSLIAVKQNEFADILRPLMKRHMIVAFLENNLTTQDFLCARPKTQVSCYTYLRSVAPRTYYAVVEQPLEALHTFRTLPTWHVVNQTGKLQPPVKCVQQSIKLITFNQTIPTRARTLMTHDLHMNRIARNINCPVVYLYMCNTAALPYKRHVSIAKRMKRAPQATVTTGNSSTTPTPTATTGLHPLIGSRFVLYYSKLEWKDKLQTIQINVSGITEQISDTKIAVELTTTDKPITFEVEQSAGYYVIKRFVYNNISYHTLDMEMPAKSSYYCSVLVLRHMGTTLQWTNLQFQVKSSAKEVFKSFHEAWHCTGFFSAGIISGLFVMGFVISIAMCGVCWIMDINAVDRFDTPYGKTIHVVVEN